MWIHRWLGLVLGVMVAILGLSGTALVYRAELERWQARDLLEVEPAAHRLTLDKLAAAANAAWPEKRLTRFVLTDSPRASLEVVLQTPGARNLKEAELVAVFVDPYDGTVLGSIERTRGWVWWLQDLHYALFLAQPGLMLNGLFAAGLLLLAVTGPVLWWPGRRRLKTGLRIRSTPALARWRDLHAVVGVLASVILALIAATGLYYAFRAPATVLITWATGDAPLRPPAVVAAAGTAAPLETLHAAARRALPDATLDELRPGRPGGAASVTFRLPGDRVVGRHRAWFDPVTAATLRIDRHDRVGAGPRLSGNMAPWHFGTFGGAPTRALWFVAGLAPTLLFGTGLWLWTRRRRRVGTPTLAAAGAGRP